MARPPVPEDFTKEELALLTQEELDALTAAEDGSAAGDGGDDDAGTDDDQTVLEADSAEETPESDDDAGSDEGDDTGEDDDAGGEDDETGEDEEAAAAAAAAESADQDAETGDETTDEEPGAGPPQPAAAAIPQIQAPEDAENQLAEINKQLDDLAAKFDEGELTAVEYRSQTRGLENDAQEIKNAQFAANFSQEMRQSTWEQITVPAFLENHSEYGTLQEPSPLFGALDQAVRDLQTADIKAGADPANQFQASYLARAHELVQAKMRAALGIPAPGQETTTTETTQTNGQGKKNGKGKTNGTKRTDIPPTLAHVPASDNHDLHDTGKFAAIDRLEGLAYEDAVAALSPAEREEFLASR